MINDNILNLKNKKNKLSKEKNNCQDSIKLKELNLKINIIDKKIDYELFKKNILKKEVMKYNEFINKFIVLKG